MEHRANLALYFGQDLVSSATLTQSEIQALFDSRSFDNWKKARENREKTMGAVINGTDPGRRSPTDITLFDGTGVGLQDLAVAAAVVDLAVQQGIAIEVDV